MHDCDWTVCWQGVRLRLKKTWCDRFKKKITRWYFLAREHGFVPRCVSKCGTNMDNHR
jgi:hypothetical protein